MTSQPDFDVIIVGGGMVGATLALALANSARRIAVIEAVSIQASTQPSYDDRGLVLSLSSQRILARLGLWDALTEFANPVEHIHVSDQKHFGFTRLHATSLDYPALGYVVIARALGKVLLDKVARTPNIEWICPATVYSINVNQDSVSISIEQNGVSSVIDGKVMLAADGTKSHMCELLGIEHTQKYYGQTAIVTNVTSLTDHANTAYERFSRQGPLALLPMTGQRCAVVYTVSDDQVKYVLGLPDAEFLILLQQRFGLRLGRFLRCGTRKSYPLIQSIAKEQVRERVVIVGNSAHTIHPNGAQGFNLCLRDIAGLVEILEPELANGKDPGKRQVLNRYRDLRTPDQVRIINFTEILAEAFYNNSTAKMLLRNSAMTLLDLCPPLKSSFVKKMVGLSGRQPEMVRSFQ